MTCEIVDTNVVLIANGQHKDISPECVVACALRLQKIMQGGKIALDDQFLILLEYQNKTTPKRDARPGDAFVKWALQNSANVDRVDQIPIIEHPARGFESFPDHPELANFDPPDRKFVAVACAHPETPPILQAADSKWLGWSEALAAHEVIVDFLCPTDIARFQANKASR